MLAGRTTKMKVELHYSNKCTQRKKKCTKDKWGSCVQSKRKGEVYIFTLQGMDYTGVHQICGATFYSQETLAPIPFHSCTLSSCCSSTVFRCIFQQ